MWKCKLVWMRGDRVLHHDEHAPDEHFNISEVHINTCGHLRLQCCDYLQYGADVCASVMLGVTAGSLSLSALQEDTNRKLK